MKANFVTECDGSKIKTKKSHIEIKSQCRKLSRKLRIKDSPTLVLVNEQGKIAKTIIGYSNDKDYEKRNQQIKMEFGINNRIK